MRLKPVLMIAGLMAAAGVTAAVAADRQEARVVPVHVLNVHMPDGSIQQVRYTGDVAPRVVAVPVATADPMMVAFGPDSPFAMMDRISAQMDAQMAGMMHQAAMMQSMTPEQLQQAAMRSGGGAGTTSFTMVSSTGADGQVCSQSVRTVSLGDGKAPQIQRTSSGDCGSTVSRPQGLTPTAAPAAQAAPVATPAVLPAAKAPAPKPDRNTI
ncbi:hypothetical protein [Sphingomonas oryzagri]|uniref:Uncharacterized protein n=1 Tax=Sphingomonas oryzagri TaxID=3042314 RepID=A0ABT6N4K9_9SPHN|nr:hypothetical protein [Sphingomonas oryzagri]MDH7640076.1 hypothetical protein [Sphingomonas oryzagri]